MQPIFIQHFFLFLISRRFPFIFHNWPFSSSIKCSNINIFNNIYSFFFFRRRRFFTFIPTVQWVSCRYLRQLCSIASTKDLFIFHIEFNMLKSILSWLHVRNIILFHKFRSWCLWGHFLISSSKHFLFLWNNNLYFIVWFRWLRFDLCFFLRNDRFLFFRTLLWDLLFNN